MIAALYAAKIVAPMLFMVLMVLILMAVDDTPPGWR